jgi:hypothetical protein
VLSLPARVHTMLRTAPLETKHHHGSVELGIPGLGRLFEDIQSLCRQRTLFLAPLIRVYLTELVHRIAGRRFR